jgi:hypothetical protein
MAEVGSYFRRYDCTEDHRDHKKKKWDAMEMVRPETGPLFPVRILFLAVQSPEGLELDGIREVDIKSAGQSARILLFKSSR